MMSLSLRTFASGGKLVGSRYTPQYAKYEDDPILSFRICLGGFCRFIQGWEGFHMCYSVMQRDAA